MHHIEIQNTRVWANTLNKNTLHDTSTSLASLLPDDGSVALPMYREEFYLGNMYGRVIKAVFHFIFSHFWILRFTELDFRTISPTFSSSLSENLSVLPGLRTEKHKKILSRVFPSGSQQFIS